MLKKLTLLAMSVAMLLALAAPAAQATGPLITNAKGEAAKTITAMSTKATMETVVAKVECTTVDLHVNLVENAKTSAGGSGIGTGEGTPKATPVTHTGHCGIFASNGVAEVTSITHGIQLVRSGIETIGGISLSYTYDLRTSGGALFSECTCGGSVPVKKSTRTPSTSKVKS